MINIDKEDTLFLELVQVALGTRTVLSHNLTELDWLILFEKSKKQAVASFVLSAVDKLTENNVKPPKHIIYEWIGIGEKTAIQNNVANRRCAEISKIFEDVGFRSCILKGQGNAQLYDNYLSRSPGDIDIWIDADRQSIRRFVVQRYPNTEDSELHIEFPVFDDVPVEVHYRPTISRSYKYNKRLQEYYDQWGDACFQNAVQLGDGRVNVPVPEFNVVMQLSHVMNHFFEEGIGLRQIIDLFYLLKKTSFDRPQMGITLRHLGMDRFTGAVMWVLHNELGLEENYLVVKPDRRRGQLLIKDILAGGNFGRYDNRNEKRLYSKSPLAYKIVRNMKYAWLYPMESFLSPAFAKLFKYNMFD